MYELLIVDRVNENSRFAYTRDLSKIELAENEFVDYCEYID